MPLTKETVLSRMGTDQRAMRRNIRNWYQQATDEQIMQGREWYGNALDIAITVSELADIDIVRAAAIVSAYSPQVSWTANKKAALEFAATGRKISGILGESHDRAIRVLSATDPIAELNAKTGKAHKIVSFARNILGETDSVTIDVWAARAALGMRDDVETVIRRTGAYHQVQAAYMAVAREYGISGPVLQAIVWVTIRGRAT